MLSTRDNFIASIDEGLTICGCFCGGDSIHVGIYWHSENERRIFHFQNGDDIKVEDATLPDFSNYFFAPLLNFDNELLPLVTATAELIAQNKLNGFIFKRTATYYDGGKFEYKSGAFTGKSLAEKFINCAVFTFAFLKSFDHIILEWDTWPNVDPANRTFLDIWLNSIGVPTDKRTDYYNKTKAVRGKHVVVSPLTLTQPSPFNENQILANQVIQFLSTQTNC